MAENYRTTEYNGEVVQVSEETIRDFCGVCSRLGPDNVCNGFPDGYEFQPGFAVSLGGECSWAKVDGLLGTLRKDGLTPSDWLTPMRDAMVANITPEITKLATAADPHVLQEAKSKIENGLADYKKTYPGKSNSWYLSHFFNNWCSHLPSRQYGTAISRYRETLQYIEHWDIPDSEAYKDDELQKKRSSPLRWGQKGKEFYATIDACLMAEGLDLEEIIRMNGGNKKEEDFAKLYAYTLPAFTRLLAVGYNFRELIS